MQRIIFLRIILLIILFQSYSVRMSFSQNIVRTIDSLALLLKTAKEDTAKVNLLIALSADESRVAGAIRFRQYLLR